MYVTQVRTEGFRHAQALTDLGREVVLSRGVAGATLADAMQLWAATLAPERLPAVLVRLGAASSEAAVETTVESGWLTGVGCDQGRELMAMLEPSERRFAVELTIEADPPFFGRLREHAVRDPRLVTALGQAPTIQVRIGWFLSKDGCSTTIGLLALTVGKMAFPVTGAERPVWAPSVMADIGRRVSRTRAHDAPSVLGERLLQISTGTDPERRQRLRRASRALAKAPFHLGSLELVRVGGGVEPAFGDALVRARRLGPSAVGALSLVEQVLIEQPDILIVDAAGAGQQRPGPVHRWTVRQTEGDDATLEQVFFVYGGRP